MRNLYFYLLVALLGFGCGRVERKNANENRCPFLFNLCCGSNHQNEPNAFDQQNNNASNKDHHNNNIDKQEEKYIFEQKDQSGNDENDYKSIKPNEWTIALQKLKNKYDLHDYRINNGMHLPYFFDNDNNKDKLKLKLTKSAINFIEVFNCMLGYAPHVLKHHFAQTFKSILDSTIFIKGIETIQDFASLLKGTAWGLKHKNLIEKSQYALPLYYFENKNNFFLPEIPNKEILHGGKFSIDVNPEGIKQTNFLIRNTLLDKRCALCLSGNSGQGKSELLGAALSEFNDNIILLESPSIEEIKEIINDKKRLEECKLLGIDELIIRNRNKEKYNETLMELNTKLQENNISFMITTNDNINKLEAFCENIDKVYYEKKECDLRIPIKVKTVKDLNNCLSRKYTKKRRFGSLFVVDEYTFYNSLYFEEGTTNLIIEDVQEYDCILQKVQELLKNNNDHNVIILIDKSKSPLDFIKKQSIIKQLLNKNRVVIIIEENFNFPKFKTKLNKWFIKEINNIDLGYESRLKNNAKYLELSAKNYKYQNDFAAQFTFKSLIEHN